MHVLLPHVLLHPHKESDILEVLVHCVLPAAVLVVALFNRLRDPGLGLPERLLPAEVRKQLTQILRSWTLCTQLA